jgi:hypothetical protein
LDEALFNLHSPFRSLISGLGILIRRMVVLSNSLKVTFPEVGMPWSTETGGFGWGTARLQEFLMIFVYHPIFTNMETHRFP